MKVLLELHASDSRAVEEWLMHSTVQQRLIFDDRFEYSPFASTFASDDAALPPVNIAPLELDVAKSAASVDCLMHLTQEEVSTCEPRQGLFSLCYFSAICIISRWSFCIGTVRFVLQLFLFCMVLCGYCRAGYFWRIQALSNQR